MMISDENFNRTVEKYSTQSLSCVLKLVDIVLNFQKGQIILTDEYRFVLEGLSRCLNLAQDAPRDSVICIFDQISKIFYMAGKKLRNSDEKSSQQTIPITVMVSLQKIANEVIKLFYSSFPVIQSSFPGASSKDKIREMPAMLAQTAILGINYLNMDLNPDVNEARLKLVVDGSIFVECSSDCNDVLVDLETKLEKCCVSFDPSVVMKMDDCVTFYRDDSLTFFWGSRKYIATESGVPGPVEMPSTKFVIHIGNAENETSPRLISQRFKVIHDGGLVVRK